MRGNIRNLIGLFVLASLAASTWLLSRPQIEADTATQSETQLQLGYYMTQAILHRTDDQGRIYYRVFAERVDQSEQTDDLVLKAVRVEYEPDTEIHWGLTATEAIAPSTGSQLALSRGVRLTSTLGDASENTTIETDELFFDVASSAASSDSQITMWRGNTIFEATGLRANLRQDYLELQADVKVRTTP